MPSETYQHNKQSIYKWRENNQDVYRAYVKTYSEKYNKENRNYINRKTLGNYYYKKEASIFRNILLDNL
jgi:hypothetical protein